MFRSRPVRVLVAVRALASAFAVTSCQPAPSESPADSSRTSPTTAPVNEPPTPPVVRLVPLDPVTGQHLDLVFETPASDPDGDPLTQTISWSIDGAVEPSVQDSTMLGAEWVRRGRLIEASVAVTDGAHEPPPVVRMSVTVGNAAPAVEYVRIQPTSPADRENLEVVVSASDAEGDSLTMDYQWFRDGVEVPELAHLASVDADFTMEDELWSVVVSVSDGLAVTSGTGSTTIHTTAFYRLWDYTEGVASDSDADGTWDMTRATRQVINQADARGYGYVDCEVWYALTSMDAPTCSGCVYAFDFQLGYDPTSSTLVTPAACSYLAVDGAGSATLDQDDLMTFYAAGPGLGGYDAYGAPFLRGDASTAFTIAFNYWYAGAGTRDARQHYEYIETDGTLRFTILRYRYVRYTE